MEGNPHVDINKEQKIDSKNSKEKIFCKKPEGTFSEAPWEFFFVYEHYY